MNMAAEQIKRLLKDSEGNSIARECLEALSEDASLNLKSTGPLPTRHVLRTLTIRRKTSAEGGALVEGFDDLLEALNAFPDEQVENHVFQSNNEVFWVLTNVDVTELVGVLAIRETTLLEFDK